MDVNDQLQDQATSYVDKSSYRKGDQVYHTAIYDAVEKENLSAPAQNWTLLYWLRYPGYSTTELPIGNIRWEHSPL